MEGYTKGCDKCPTNDCIEEFEAELERLEDGVLEIRYYIPYKYVKGYEDIEDLLLTITHEWLHVACIRCGYDPPEKIIEKLTQLSFS
jgi:hypothetical protein